MIEPDKEGVIARLSASAPRRAIALVLLYALGAMLVYLAFASLAGPVGVVFLLVMGAVVLWAAERMRRGTAGEIRLTEAGLEDAEGGMIAAMGQITEVNRGAFAMKPSNGFTLVLTEKQPRAWRPGLWWRLGRRVGVGGIVSAGAAKFMAEQIAFRIAARDGASR